MTHIAGTKKPSKGRITSGEDVSSWTTYCLYQVLIQQVETNLNGQSFWVVKFLIMKVASFLQDLGYSLQVRSIPNSLLQTAVTSTIGANAVSQSAILFRPCVFFHAGSFVYLLFRCSPISMDFGI